MANSITAKIVDYRFIGKVQLTADDMGGVGCANWDQYLNVCSVLSVAAWNHTIGKATDDQIINTAIAGLLDFFGIEVVDSARYTARILSVLVNRKAQRSQALKDALKVKKLAKEALDKYDPDIPVPEDETVFSPVVAALAFASGMNADIANKEATHVIHYKTLEELEADYEDACAKVDALYREPKNYWFDPAPGFDTRTFKAKPAIRKALEDTCADIYTERQFMSADELKAERIALDDQRKGRKMRKKAEAKAKAEA